MKELIIDGFAGGGGASEGVEWALGESPDIAINHDEDAISMHAVNHPLTKHYREDIWAVDPRKATRGRPVGLAWWSPDCTHFSIARGGKPAEKRIRSLAWVILRWVATVHPRVNFLENVKEFLDWGPLLPDGRPDPARKGETFRSFVRQLEQHGYKVEWRVLQACDYGAPTKRERLYMCFRNDGEPIIWPEPTHGDPNSDEVKCGKLKPWRTAAEIIDWSIPVPSIFGRKKELAENTKRRIAKGIMKFVINNPNPFIVTVNHGGSGFRGQEIDRPLGTSYICKFRGTNIGQPLDTPLHTISAGGNHHALVKAFLIKYYGAGIGQDLRDPLGTIVSKDRFGLVYVHGTPYQIVDIGMRMLQPHELFAGQGFGPDYIFTHGHDGRKFSKKVQVDKCGNSVCPQMSNVLIGANYQPAAAEVMTG